MRSPLLTLRRGTTVVEFALVPGLFVIILLLGIMEMGRAFFYLNASAEATRLGARLAVVCDKSAAQQDRIRDRMREFVGVLPADRIAFDYLPDNSCGGGTCRSVTVHILPGATFDTVIPFVPLAWTLPPFATTLPTESLDSTNNSICQ